MDQPSYDQIGRFYLPLAASGLLMTLQQPVVTAAIARMADAETALAAYGVALNIVVLVESPVQMLLPTANAVGQDQLSYRLLRRFTLFIGLALSGLLLLMASSPLGVLTVSGLIQAPAKVTQQVLPTLLVMALWPLLVGWRRFYQGWLIQSGQPQVIGYATACRLLTLTVVVILAVNGSNWPGALVSSLALIAGAGAEAAVVTARVWLLLKAGWPNNRPELELVPTKAKVDAISLVTPSGGSGDERQPPAPRFGSVAALARFYLPLAATSVLTVVTWPLLTAGISRAAEPTPSLAAWPVALSLLWLLTTPLQMLQQVAITLAQEARSFQRVIRFGLAIGLLGSLVLATFAFTPLVNLFLQYVVAAPTEVAPLVIFAARILVPLPLVVAAQSLLQGLLIRRGTTGDVRLAMLVNLVVLSLLLLGGLADGRLAGAILAPIAMLGGLLAETAVLWWRFKTFGYTGNEYNREQYPAAAVHSGPGERSSTG
ncbi:MAG: hypothetical protein DPW09_39445 [Anaerolineae bacterium]|nr:hypothetical protein [Anaerolineae bacterium]GIK38938.1 MAG: hypothetical protein BroJett011_27710 [Chloroflexota bacterium]